MKKYNYSSMFFVLFCLFFYNLVAYLIDLPKNISHSFVDRWYKETCKPLPVPSFDQMNCGINIMSTGNHKNAQDDVGPKENCSLLFEAKMTYISLVDSDNAIILLEEMLLLCLASALQTLDEQALGSGKDRTTHQKYDIVEINHVEIAF